MKKKTLFIHVGTPKTGTTTIQSFLYLNRKTLKEYGILYPIADNEDLIHMYNNTSNMILKLNKDKKIQLKTLKEMKKYWIKNFLPIINSSHINKIILSDEHISHLDSDFYDIFDNKNFDIKGIVYLRRPAEFFISDYAEVVKSFEYKDSFEHYVNSRKYTFYQKITKHILKLGKDNFYVRPYEKQQWKNNNLIEDFLEIFQLELNNDFIIPDNCNITPSRNKIEIIRLKNILEPEFEKSKEYSYKIINATEKPNSLKLIESIDDEKILQLTNKFMPEINEISKIIGKEKFFISNLPECYGKQRETFNKVIFSLDELNTLHDIFKEIIERKSHKIIKTNKKNCIITKLKERFSHKKSKSSK